MPTYEIAAWITVEADDERSALRIAEDLVHGIEEVSVGTIGDGEVQEIDGEDGESDR